LLLDRIAAAVILIAVMNPGTFIVIFRGGSEIIQRDGSDAHAKTGASMARLPFSIAHDAERVLYIDERGAVHLLKDPHDTELPRQLLAGLKHRNPYTSGDRRMPPSEVWADGYAAGLKDGAQ
jgi:hypothetical protein